MSESERNADKSEIPKRERRPVTRDGIDYEKPGMSNEIFGHDIEFEHDDFSPDGSEDEFIPPKMQRNQSNKPRGHAAYRARSQTRARRGRARGYSMIERAEMLSRHEGTVEELREEDLERGLKIKSPHKTVRERNLPVLSKGNSQMNPFLVIFVKYVYSIVFVEEVNRRIAELHEKIQLKTYTYQKREGFKSDVWDVFYIILDESGKEIEQFFYCIRCSEIEYSARSGGSTTQLLRHPCVCKSESASIDNLSVEKLKKAAAKFICCDLRPMNAIEGDGIREIFMAGIELGKKYPKVNTENLAACLPSRKSVKTIINQEADDAKQRIKAIFKSAVAEGGFGCTLDMWTDKYKHNTYMAMTANVYLSTDKCIEQKRIVFNMEHLSEIYKSKELVKLKIISTFGGFDISPAQMAEFITFTTDR